MGIFSILASILVGFTTLLVLYILYKSRNYGLFRKMGIKFVKPWPAVGSWPEIVQMGITGFHRHLYNEYRTEKVYGYFSMTPTIAIRDLDMIREVMVKNFNCFVNKRVFTTEEPSNHSLLSLKDDHWRHVRHTVSPAFSSGKLKKMCVLVEQTAKSLTSNIRKICQEGKEIELKHVLGCYTMDVIANTGFSVSVDSLNDENSPFVTEAKTIMNPSSLAVLFVFMFPALYKLLSKLGITRLFPKKSVAFFNSFLDAALESRRQEEQESASASAGSSSTATGGDGGVKRQRHDFVQLLSAEQVKHSEGAAGKNKRTTSAADVVRDAGVGDEEGEEENRQERHGLSRLEMQGQAFVFILAGYDTVSSVLSFTLFILAHQPDITKKVQEELDEVLAGKGLTYENVNDLVYLDMCINEAMRMYPPGFLIDRMCTKDCEIEGVNIPKGMSIMIPFEAIHNDPELFPKPEEFDPERFTPENKASRHPFAFSPFGQGPRNCIGMRLAQMEMKMAIASVLLDMTPVPCSKSVYPPKLEKFQLKAQDGLWVKFEPRKKD